IHDIVTNDFCKTDTVYLQALTLPSGMTATGPPPKTVLKNGESMKFDVKFDPNGGGGGTGSLALNLTSECGNAPASAPISGNTQSGISGIVSNDSIVDLGVHKICEPATGTIKLTNGVCEDATVTLGTTINGPFSVSFTPADGKLKKGDVETFT